MTDLELQQLKIDLVLRTAALFNASLALAGQHMMIIQAAVAEDIRSQFEEAAHAIKTFVEEDSRLRGQAKELREGTEITDKQINELRASLARNMDRTADVLDQVEQPTIKLLAQTLRREADAAWTALDRTLSQD